MLFWLTISLSLLCILRTEKSRQLNRWDILFLTSSWQVFNLGIWTRYLEPAVSDPYRTASIVCILLTALYMMRRGIGISLEISGEAIKEWLTWTIILVGTLVPIGVCIGFLRWNLRLQSDFLKTTLIDYFLFVAVVEELVFRGFIFNLLKRSWNGIFALLVTTVLFATIFSHIAGGGSFPNWPYVGMAFLAGSAYGISYHRTGNILIPILIHGTVDSAWRIFFS